ncbi:hypothetical protein [Feifania hominis]|uniref:Uncharacterized protein n=1 Tax=Feifania hominis TaxID=2763660 RepID=A0A926DHQ0_9FIRM|nr:hypothetical protein [Feifania hominis]MBC8537270.1 hypothetical protein [Feifania hominis]
MFYFLAVLLVLLGVLLGAFVTLLCFRSLWVPQQVQKGGEENAPPTRMLRQFENFFNYDGTERGQREIED